MKAIIKSITCKILFIIVMHGSANNASAHVYLDYPYGGEIFQGNTFITLEWHIAIPHNQLNWDLYFSTDGGNSWQPIQLDLPVSQTTLTWLVPNIATGTARISVIQDNTEMDYQDESMNFTIEPEPNTPFIDITAQDINIDCNSANQQAAIENWLNNNGGATAIGFCGDLVWSNDFFELSNECGATGTAFVTFTAEDECGMAMTSAYVRVYDFNAPSIDIAANDMVVECSGSNNFTQLYNWINNHGGAIASDACSNVTWSNDFSNLSNECSTTGTATVTFTATDACGNTSTTAATFSIVDNTSPAINQAAQHLIVSCEVPNTEALLQSWLQNHGGATASDVCGNVTWSNNYNGISDGCGNSGNATVIFTATDDCGNSSITSAVFIIQDTLNPQITVDARDTVIQCEIPGANAALQLWLENRGGAIANDMCGTVTWSNNFPVLADTCDMTRSISVTFTANDECGNQDTTNALVTMHVTTVATQDNLQNFYFTISPNPVTDVLKIELDKMLSFPVQLSILDVKGEQVFTTRQYANTAMISVGEYVPGIYLVRAESVEGVFARKVVIQP